MEIIQKTERGIEYLSGLLKHGVRVYTRALFWKIPHHDIAKEDISLKVGRYVLVDGYREELETKQPKSELTLDNEEFLALIEFIQANYPALKDGVKKYIPITEDIDSETIDYIKGIFDNPDKYKLIEFIQKHNLMPDDLMVLLEHKKRIEAVKKFEEMLGNDLLENKWQQWFTENSWVLGSEFVSVLDEREIDTKNISDFLMKAYDGFLDIIEIKRPEGGLEFWSQTTDHENQIPTQDLIKAVIQSSKYIYEIEQEANSLKFFERVGDIKVIKPRSILIYGRSTNWTEDQKIAYRILNSSYHNLTILTFDHVLERAKRMLGIN